MATSEGDDAVTIMTTIMTTQIVTAGDDTASTTSLLETLTSTSSLDVATTSSAIAATPSTASIDSTTSTTTPAATTASPTTTTPNDTQPTPAATTSTTEHATPTSVAPIANTTPTTTTLVPTTSNAGIFTTSKLPQAILPPSSSTGVFLPTVLTQAQSSSALSSFSTSTLLASTTSTAAAAVTSSAGLAANSDSRKQAVVGGIAGAVGGSFFIAIFLLLCFYDRRRRRDKRLNYNTGLISSPRPAAPTAQSSFAPIPYYVNHKRGSDKSYKTADGTLIQVDTDGFPRPFAEKASWRELAGMGKLHVMNPDRSQPATPNIGTDAMPAFISGKKGLPGTVTTTEVPEHDYPTPRQTPAQTYQMPTIQSSPAPPPPDITRTPPIEALPAIHRSGDDLFYQAAYRRSREAPPLTLRQGTPRQMSTTIGNAFIYSGNGRNSASDSTPGSSRRVSSATDPFDLESPYVSQGARFVMQRPPRAARTPLPRMSEDR